MAMITERVEQARTGKNPNVICQVQSGWVVIGDVQFLPGYCLLLPDPVVPSLNDLSGPERMNFLRDMAMIGDAILEVTQAARINYEILGNTDPELHAHIFPRYSTEIPDKRRMPVWFYDWKSAPPFTETEHGELKASLARAMDRRMAAE